MPLVCWGFSSRLVSIASVHRLPKLMINIKPIGLHPGRRFSALKRSRRTSLSAPSTCNGQACKVRQRAIPDIPTALVSEW